MIVNDKKEKAEFLYREGFENPKRNYPEVTKGLYMSAYMAGQRGNTFDLIDGPYNKQVEVGFPV